MKALRLSRLVAICAIGLACQTGGEADRIPIAVVPFGVAKGGTAPPIDVAAVIHDDLAASGRFELLDAAELPSRPTRLSEIRFDDWRRTGADFLVVGLVARVHDGGHEVEFRLVDLHARTSRTGFMLPSAPDALHGTALEIAERIEQELDVSSRPSRDAPRA